MVKKNHNETITEEKARYLRELKELSAQTEITIPYSSNNYVDDVNLFDYSEQLYSNRLILEKAIKELSYKEKQDSTFSKTNKDFSFSKEYQDALNIVREGVVAESLKKADKMIAGLCGFFVDFKNGSPYQGSGLLLSTPVLRQAVVALWQDIIRLQSYHPINVLNRYKRAAFLFKWICKCRPIKIVANYPPECVEDYTKVNAIFAMHCAMAFLKCPPPDKEVMKEILYTGTFRCIQPEQMALVFLYMEKACSSNVSESSKTDAPN